jgi:hypothetical protein
MRIDKRPFIDFSDFHVPFSEHDLFVIDSIDAWHMQYWVNSAWAWIQDALNLFDKLWSENVLDVMNQAKNEEEAPFHMGTLIQWNISGDWLAEIIEEANKTWKSFASVIHSRKLADMSVQTFVEPSESLPEIASRKKWKNKTS